MLKEKINKKRNKNEILVEINGSKYNIKDIEKITKIKDYNDKKAKSLAYKNKKNKVEEKIEEEEIIQFIENYNNLYYFQKLIISKDNIIKYKKKELGVIVDNKLYNIEWNQIINKLELIKKILKKDIINGFLDNYFKNYLKDNYLKISHKQYIYLLELDEKIINEKITIKNKFEILKTIEPKLNIISKPKLINYYFLLLNDKTKFISHREFFNKNHTRNQDRFISWMLLLEKLNLINIENIYYEKERVYMKYNIEVVYWKSIKVPKTINNYLNRSNWIKYLYIVEMLWILSNSKTYTTSYEKIRNKIWMSKNRKTNYKINLFLKDLVNKKIIKNYNIDKNKIQLFNYSNI